MVVVGFGGPSEDEVSRSLKTWGDANGQAFDSVKSKGCQRVSKNQDTSRTHSDEPTYLCEVESTTNGERSARELDFQREGELWAYRSK